MPRVAAETPPALAFLATQLKPAFLGYSRGFSHLGTGPRMRAADALFPSDLLVNPLQATRARGGYSVAYA